MLGSCSAPNCILFERPGSGIMGSGSLDDDPASAPLTSGENELPPLCDEAELALCRSLGPVRSTGAGSATASALVGSIDTTARAEIEAKTVKLGERTTMATKGYD